MKLAIAFCALALVAGAANDAKEDGSHLKTTDDQYQVCGNPDSPQNEVIQYSFDSANNWVGDHGAKDDRTGFATVTTYYRNGARVTMAGHHEKMTGTKTTLSATEKTTKWQTRAFAGYQPHSTCETQCLWYHYGMGSVVCIDQNYVQTYTTTERYCKKNWGRTESCRRWQWSWRKGWKCKSYRSGCKKYGERTVQKTRTISVWAPCSAKYITLNHQKTEYSASLSQSQQDYLAGYCNIASYNGENMWVVAGSAANNEYEKNVRLSSGSSTNNYKQDGKDVTEKTTYVGVETYKSSDDNHYCALQTVDTYTKPDQECQLSYFIDTWGSLEKDDVTCITALKTNDDVITRKCLNGAQMGSDPTHTITTPWFAGDDTFRISLAAITQGTYFNGHEIIAHDDVKLTCRPCATPAPTSYPTPAPTSYPTPSPTAYPTAQCRMTCEISQDTGLIEVTHDATSGHSKHMCYINDQDDCVCECDGHDITKEEKLQCTAGDQVDLWDSTDSWTGGTTNGNVGKYEEYTCLRYGYERRTYCSWWSRRCFNYNAYVCKEYGMQTKALGFCTQVAWASDYRFHYCTTADRENHNSACYLAPYDNSGSGQMYFPLSGGSFCTWESEVKKIDHADQKLGMKSGIRGLNVMLKWKELGDKNPNDRLEVEIKSCQNEAMTHHCTDWTTAHYHADDLEGGWRWTTQTDESHLEVDNKDMFYQVRLRIDAEYKGWGGRLTDGYAVDALAVVVEDCEHDEA